LSICRTEDVYRCPAGERLTYRYTTNEEGRQGPAALLDDRHVPKCPLKSQCTKGPEATHRARWEHEHLLEAVQQRLDANPKAMRPAS